MGFYPLSISLSSALCLSLCDLLPGNIKFMGRTKSDSGRAFVEAVDEAGRPSIGFHIRNPVLTRRFSTKYRRLYRFTISLSSKQVALHKGYPESVKMRKYTAKATCARDCMIIRQKKYIHRDTTLSNLQFSTLEVVIVHHRILHNVPELLCNISTEVLFPSSPSSVYVQPP